MFVSCCKKIVAYKYTIFLFIYSLETIFVKIAHSVLIAITIN